MKLADAGPVGSTSPKHSGLDERGYILVVLLVAMAVAAVWMTAALPSWRQQAIREREAELVFRGEQYARAITLYYCKNNGTYPQSIDQLVSQHYLRHKYKDPITDEEFVPLGGNMPIQSTPGRITPPMAPPSAGTPGRGTGGTPGVAQAGITGVRSSSQDTSIRVYNNQQVYSQWAFDASAMFNRMGASQRCADSRAGPEAAAPVCRATPGVRAGAGSAPGPGRRATRRPGGPGGGSDQEFGLAALARRHLPTGRPGGGGPIRGGGRSPDLAARERVRDSVVDARTQPDERVVRARRMHAIRQQHDVEVLLAIDPE